MLGRALFPTALAEKAPQGGGGFRNSFAGRDFSKILNELFAPGLISTTLPVLLKAEREPAQGKREKELSFFKKSGELEKSPGLKEGAGQLYSKRLRKTLEEILGEEFSFSCFLARWEEFPLPMKEQFLNILAGEVFGLQSQPCEAPGPGGSSSAAGAFFAAFSEAEEYLINLLQASGLLYRQEGAANPEERLSGFHPGDPFGQQSSGAAAEALPSSRQGEAAVETPLRREKLLEQFQALLFEGSKGQPQSAKEVFFGESALKQNTFAFDTQGTAYAGAEKYLRHLLQVDGEGAGLGEAFSSEAAMAEAFLRGEKPLEQFHAPALKDLKGQLGSGEELFSDSESFKGEVFKEKPVFSALFGGGPQGEGMGNASASYVSSQASELLQYDSRDVVEQILQRMDFLARQGEQELRLKLQPEFLGEVLIRMRRVRGVLSAEIITGHPSVKEMLEGQLDMLRQRFQQMNLNVERFDVLLKDGGEEGFAFGREPRGDEPRPSGTYYSLPGAGEEEVPLSGYSNGDGRVDYLV